MSRCGIIILAAGGSTRMGSAKQALQLNGVSLLERAIQTAMDSICRPIVVVLGARAHQLKACTEMLPVRVVVNENWATGMGASIRAGIEALADDKLDAAMIFLCDQPLLNSQTLDRLVRTHFSGDKLMTVAFYAESLGTPAVFSEAMFGELLGLKQDQGGKVLFRRHSEQVQSFCLPEAEVDLDTPEDLQKFMNHGQPE